MIFLEREMRLGGGSMGIRVARANVRTLRRAAAAAAQAERMRTAQRR
jgi:hypothetical protein